MRKTLYLKLLLLLHISKYMFILYSFKHDCHGDTCHICPFIYKLIDQNHVLNNGLFKFILLLGLLLIISILIKSFVNKLVNTLVRLKVKLTS